jgi:hypothetical protein
MKTPSMHEESMLYKYLLLSSKIVQVLQFAEGEENLTEIQVKTLRKGEKLLTGIIEGSAFSEGITEDQSLSAPTQEGITIYGYALSTIEILPPQKESGHLTGFFFNQLTTIKTLAEKKIKNDLDLSSTSKFFSMLGNVLREEIHKERYVSDTPILINSLMAHV